MKKVILVLLMVTELASAQLSFDFESGETTGWIQNTNGRWIADTYGALSGSYSLHHMFDNAEAGYDVVAWEVKNLHPDEGTITWSFLLRHGYDPSSQNNWAVFLMSGSGPENMSVSSCSGGYAIGVNMNSSDDSLRIVKINEGSITQVVNCRINWQTDIGSVNPAKIIVKRSAAGEWEVSVYKKTGELIRSSAGFNDGFYLPWFGIGYKYSSTRDKLLWIDDILIDGVFYSDTTPPSITECSIKGNNSLEVVLSEEPSDMLTVGNFMLNDELNASSVQKLSDLKFGISFPSVFRNKQTNLLSLLKICDKSGNCAEKLIAEFSPVWAETGDVAITEIMADPVPSVSLPESEYIEITNRTDYTYDLTGWNLNAGGQPYSFPDVGIDPGEVMILCHNSTSDLFASYGKVAGFSSFPVLNDDGKLIWITDSSGVLISGVEYSPAWYNNDLKSEGGWSLEIMDMSYPFYDNGNWTASVSSSGGTPGRENSVAKHNADIAFTGIVNVFPLDSLHLRITFSEPIIPDSGIQSVLKIDNHEAFSISRVDPLCREFEITIEESLRIRRSYDLEVSGTLADFAGNSIENKVFTFALPEKSARGDIMFNEVLFNPLPGGADYIEFFNVSPKTVDVSRLYLVSVDEAGDTSSMVSVSDEPGCLMPSSYYAITDDKEMTISSFPGGDEERIFKVVRLPSMPDDNGHLLLLNRELEVIDEVYYDDEMHYSLVSGTEGISLEKISPALESAERSNWHSASETVGWGTPGRENSVYTEFPESASQVSLSSTRITPDSDGLDDILGIGLKFPGTGNVVSASVFDESGSLVRLLAMNLLCSPEAMLNWDGTADDGAPVGTGIYVILITWYNDTGQTGRWKKVCTVIR